jgi:DNA-binding transcriptional MerR regulator/methylmalonyl-CoA mutase cobalamin-binding subunit
MNDREAEGAASGLIRIGELSRRTGISPDLLRAWERRYGLLAPARSSGGFRLYSPADEAAVREMSALLSGGLSPAEAARQVSAAPAEAAAAAPALSPEGTARRILRAIDAYDEEEVNSALDEGISALTVDALAQGIVLPVLREIGDRWKRGELLVGQEHFASDLIRARLLNLGRGWGTGTGPRALLACLPGEQHDLGLIVFSLVLRRRGWRITFLGQNTPLDSLSDAIGKLGPHAIVLVSLVSGRFEEAQEELAGLRRDGATLMLGGSGAREDLARRVRAVHLAGGPVQEAVRLATEPEPTPA